MNKSYVFLVGLLVLMSVGFGSASCLVPPIDNITVIAGMISINDNEVNGANVTVTCYHNGEVNVRHAVSGENFIFGGINHQFDGLYHVVFPEEDCNYGDLVSVYASSGGLTRLNNDTIWLLDDINVPISMCSLGIHGYIELDLGWNDVPLVPEFGFFVGMLTILSAIGIFFVIRRD